MVAEPLRDPEGARELGYKDLGAMWRSNYDMPPAEFAKFVAGQAAMPSWLSAIADVFPLRHLLAVMLAATPEAGLPGAEEAAATWLRARATRLA